MNQKEVIVFDPVTLANRLKDIDNIPDEEIYLILKQSYQIFLSNAIHSQDLIFLRRNPKFITILSQVVIEVELTLEQRIYCNAMLYKEMSETDNTYLQKLYYILGLHANQNMTHKIMATGVDKVLSTYLAIIRKSSFDMKDNVSRLNFTIMCAKPEIMTIQRITDIYCAIFNTVSEIKELFLLIVRDTYVFTSKEKWITDDILKIANNMNYAVLSILESLKHDKLKGILKDYGNMADFDELTSNDVRFSFKKIDFSNFPNIYNSLIELRKEYDLILP
jgi:hypothetical protein